MTETQIDKELWARVRDGLRVQKQRERQALDEIAGKLPAAYRAVMGDEFQLQPVLNASLCGLKIEPERWGQLDTETRDVLDFLGAKYLRKEDIGDIAKQVADVYRGHFDEQKQPLSAEQAAELPALLSQTFTLLEKAGLARFDNGLRQAYLPGLVPLASYRAWLTSGGSSSLALGESEAEYRLTDNAIQAQQRVFLDTLLAAGEVKVDYGVFRARENISGIKKATFERGENKEGQFVVAYETKDKEKGRIDVLKAHLTVPAYEAEKERLMRLLYHGRLTGEGGENLTDGDTLYVMAGQPPKKLSLALEFQANQVRSYLKLCGVDLTARPEALLAGTSETEKLTFWYPATIRGRPNGVMVGCSFDERYGDSYAFVAQRERFAEQLSRAREYEERLRREGDQPAIFDPLSVTEYLARRVGEGKRLTQCRA